MKRPAVIISGKNGQLGNQLQELSFQHPQYDFHFFSKDELDISNNEILAETFKQLNPSFFINAAAYTAVDKAETEQEQAYLINAEATGNIAKHCFQYSTRLIHVSTDYVFDGKGNKPYAEDDECKPVNYYGYSKWLGEELALHNNPATTIIRTSWVYSRYGSNFVKTMLRLMNERKEINVVADQFGSPTYAKDLAQLIMEFVNRETVNDNYQMPGGVFHFSNAGNISWYDFAMAIKEIKQFSCEINPIPTSSYPTPAKRPLYSVMSKEKIISVSGIELKDWKESLRECLGKWD
jgi:dTDP-4-dehydrorhamnose reductase